MRCRSVSRESMRLCLYIFSMSVQIAILWSLQRRSTDIRPIWSAGPVYSKSLRDGFAPMWQDALKTMRSFVDCSTGYRIPWWGWKEIRLPWGPEFHSPTSRMWSRSSYSCMKFMYSSAKMRSLLSLACMRCNDRRSTIRVSFSYGCVLHFNGGRNMYIPVSSRQHPALKRRSHSRSSEESLSRSGNSLISQKTCWPGGR